jgi:hypothetical protein
MFNKIEYNLFIEPYMTKQEYYELINDYIDKYDISYSTAELLILNDQYEKYENDFKMVVLLIHQV